MGNKGNIGNMGNKGNMSNGINKGNRIKPSITEDLKVFLWHQGRIQRGLWGLKTPIQKYIKEAKRVMYWYI